MRTQEQKQKQKRIGGCRFQYVVSEIVLLAPRRLASSSRTSENGGEHGHPRLEKSIYDDRAKNKCRPQSTPRPRAGAHFIGTSARVLLLKIQDDFLNLLAVLQAGGAAGPPGTDYDSDTGAWEEASFQASGDSQHSF